MLWLCGPEPVVPSATQVADVHSQPEESPDNEIPAVKRATRRKRDLTAQERVFLKERKTQRWIVHCTAQDIVTTREMSVQVAAEGQTDSDLTIIDEQTTEENAVAGEADDEPPKVRTCECRYCKGEAVEIGRLKGHSTNRIILTAQMIVAELDTHLPDVNPTTVSDLLGAIGLSWLTLCFLPAAIAALLGGQTLTRLEASALEARLLHELRLTPLGSALGLIFEPATDESVPTSGIPPPHESLVVAST